MLKLKTELVSFCLMLILLFACIASLIGCKPSQSIPEEGDIVIWKHSPELIIKAKLGQRRAHVITNPRHDDYFYEPEYERFIGQFSIDYQPKPFPNFTEQERIAYETEKSIKKLPPYRSSHPIQFYLMLNGVNAKATDRSIVSEQALDDINQVRVELRSQGVLADINHTTKYRHERFVKTNVNKTWHIDQQSSNEYDMKCYKKNDGGPLNQFWCFGESTYLEGAGASFSIIGNNWVLASSFEPIYGGIEVLYRLDKSKLKHWKEVDAAIWRLLESWNISPISN